METQSKEDILIIDETELSSAENAEMYVFQYLATAERAVLAAPAALLKTKQADIEKIILEITTSPAPTPSNQPQTAHKYPNPGRAIRNIAGRILVTLYTRGETKNVFDTLQAYIKAANEPSVRGVDRDVWRIAAFSCIGVLMERFGTQYMSLVSEITLSALKAAKPSGSPLLRYHALVALHRTLSAARKAVTDSTFKDIIKQTKSALSDKSLAVQRAAADVLRAAYSTPTQIQASEAESIITACIKSLDSADKPTRTSLANLVAHIIKATQVERAPPEVQTQKKDASKSKAAEGADALESGPSPITEPAKPLKTLSEALLYLSAPFNKPQTSRKTRVGLFLCYITTLSELGAHFVEKNYSVIVNHLMQEIVASSTSRSRYDTLLVRHLVHVVLRDFIGLRVLSEQGQIQAIIELANTYLKRWPAMMPGQVAPSSAVLVAVLREVAGLVQQLGNAPPPVQDALSDPLLTLLTHPSHSTRVTAAWTLRCFCHSTPLRLPKAILTMIESLNRDISLLGSNASVSTTDARSRALGHAYGLATLISIIPSRPLYVSYDIPAKVFDVATGLLKRAGEHDVTIASTEVEVAWVSIAGLMSLGTNFVKQHLPQLLVLWRNALPKPTSKELGQRKEPEQWRFLLHVRESALGAVLSFLKHNSDTLVTLDVARRVASILGNALSFANHFLGQASLLESNQDSGASSSLNQKEQGMSLRARESLLRRRVFECFSALSAFSSVIESNQATLLQASVASFTGIDEQSSSAQATIAASSAQFSSIWQSTDGYAYGVTSLDILNQSNADEGDSFEKLTTDPIEVTLDGLLCKPVLGGFEHDPLSLCDTIPKTEYMASREPPPPATAVVDAAITLFSQLLPQQDPSSTIKALGSCLDSIASTQMERHAARKSAVTVNFALSLVLGFRLATSSQTRQHRDSLGQSQVTALLAPFLKGLLADGDQILRHASSEIIGRLCSLAGTNFLATQIKQLVDQVVGNRDPYGRAGCALAFGSIYTHVGGLAAGPLLKTIVNILMSLGNDPHPVAHFWALKSLSTVINAASLSYAPFVPSTLGMLLKVYLMESHEQEGGTLINSNISGDCPTYSVVCQIIDATINVLGPDLQDSHKTRNLVLSLVRELSFEEDERIGVYAIQCFQHLLMFSPEHIDIPALVISFRQKLASPRRPLQHASINALYQLVQKDAVAMSKLGGDKLVEDLFSMLDDDSSVEGVRNVISSWLQQTVIHNPSAWIDLCQRIMSRTTASQDAASARRDVRDDEGEALSSGMTSENTASGKGHLTSRWRTQLFALQCLHQICSTVANSGRREHLDAIFARENNINVSLILVSRVPDLIKIAFTASTAYVTEIRLEGLVVLQDVIKTFSRSPDPASEGTLLLEQHQAPITAALTPAFSTDSTPEILASAIKACAIFVGSGIVQDTDRMGRILKLLTSALEQSQGSGTFTLGGSGDLSPNASAMLRISTVSAWADLQVSSLQHDYLKKVLEPHRSSLGALWLSSLRDYASIRIDSEFLQETPVSSLDSSYYNLGKEVLLPYYSEFWHALLQAVATAIEARDRFIVAAMDGLSISGEDAAAQEPPLNREEPSALFFVLFGLVYEALVSNSSDLASATDSRQTALVASLRALKSLVHPVYSGKALLDPTIYEELIGLCYRLALTESVVIQTALIETLLAFALSPSNKQADASAESRSPSTHCLRICGHILRRVLPKPSRFALSGSQQDLITMISTAFRAFRELAGHATGTQREDVRGVGVLIYSEFLKEENLDLDLVGPTLPCLKALLDLPPDGTPDSLDRLGRLVHGLASACLLNVDEMRGREGGAAVRKIKNNLLATVLVLTVIPPSVSIGRAVLEHCCFLVSQTLRNGGELGLTAAHCARTLIMASAAANTVAKQCPKLLIPGLIEHIGAIAPSINSGDNTELQASIVSEIWKSFAAFFASVSDVLRTEALCAILPTMMLLLPATSAAPSALSTQTVNQLLSYASQSPASFKQATEQLEPSTKQAMEQHIRRVVGAGSTASSSRNQTAPQISLRSF